MKRESFNSKKKTTRSYSPSAERYAKYRRELELEEEQAPSSYTYDAEEDRIAQAQRAKQERMAAIARQNNATKAITGAPIIDAGLPSAAAKYTVNSPRTQESIKEKRAKEDEKRFSDIDANIKGDNDPKVASARERLSKLDDDAYDMLMEGINLTNKGGLKNVAKNIFRSPEKHFAELQDYMGWDDKTLIDNINDAYTVWDYDRDTHISYQDEVFYRNRKLEGLDDIEKQGVSGYLDWVKTQSDDLAREVGAAVRVPTKDSAKSYLNTKEGKVLKDKGWDYKKLAEYGMYQERANNEQAQNELNSKYDIDPQSSKWDKMWGFGKADAKLVTSTAQSLFTAPVEALEKMAGLEAEKPMGFGRDINDESWRKRNAATYAQGQVSQNVITDDHPVIQWAYDTRNSMIRSGMTMGAAALMTAVGVPQGAAEVLTLMPYYTETYSSTYADARQRGASDAEANSLAQIEGSAEVLTELVSLESLMRMKTPKDFMQLMRNGLIQAFPEASEELVAGAIDLSAEYSILGQKEIDQIHLKAKEYESEEHLTREEAMKRAFKDALKGIGLQGLSGFVSGGFMGGGNTATNVVIGANTYNQYENAIKSEFNDRLMNQDYGDYSQEMAEMYANNPSRYIADNINDSTQEGRNLKQKAQGYAEKVDSGKKLSAIDKYNMLSAKEFSESSDSSQNARSQYEKAVEEISKAPSEVRGQRTNLSLDDATAEMEQAAQMGDASMMGRVYDAMRRSSSVETANNADDTYKRFRGMALANGATESQLNANMTTRAQQYVRGFNGENSIDVDSLSNENKEAYNRGKIARSEYNKQTQELSSESIKSAKITTRSGDEITLTGEINDEGEFRTVEGKYINADDIAYDGSATLRAYKNASSKDTVIEQRSYLNNIPESVNINQYNLAWNKFNEAGRMNLDFESVAKESQYMVDAFGEKALRNIFDSGKAVEMDQVLEDRSKATAELTGFNTNATFKGEDVAQKHGYDSTFLRMLAKATGVNVELVESLGEVNGNSVQADYDKASQKITLSVGHANQIIHEFGHFVEDYNKEGYDALRKDLMAIAPSIYGDKAFNDYVNKFNKAYSNVKGSRASGVDVSGEMTNDLLVAVMSTEKGRQAFAKYLSENYEAPVAEKKAKGVKGLFKKISSSLRNIFKGDSMSDMQRTAYENASDKLEQFADRFIVEFDKAIQNKKAITEQKIADESAEETKGRSKEFSVDEDVKNSLKIQVDTLTKDRYNLLKDEAITVVKVDSKIVEDNIGKFDIDRIDKDSEIQKSIKKLAQHLGITKTLFNTNEIEFTFSSSKIDESIHKQRNVKGVDNKNLQYVELFSYFDDILNNAILIERHHDKYKGMQREDANLGKVHVLISAYENSKGIVPVKLLIKEFNMGRQNKLHVAIMLPTIEKAGIMRIDRLKTDDILTPTSSDYMLSDVLTIVKKDMANDKNMGKYIPWQFGFGTELEKIDSEYEDAIKKGDIERASKMVEKAAKLSGYNIEAFHGSRYLFNEFDENMLGKNTNTQISTNWFFASDKETANSYYPYGVMKELEKQNPKMFNADKLKEENRGKLYHLYLKILNPLMVDVSDYDYSAHRDDMSSWMEFSEQAFKNRNDGIILLNAMDNQLKTKARESTVYMFRNSNQAKSAEVIEYDDKGEMIPLSERFDDRRNDFRYSLSVDTEGNSLTESQKEFFKDSKAVDENGNLKVFYHGARGAGFTIFDNAMSDDGRSFFFTDSLDIAKSYSGTRNLFNPDKKLSFNVLNNYMSDYTDGELYSQKDGENVVVYRTGLEDEIVHTGTLESARDYLLSYISENNMGKDAVYQSYLNVVNPLVVDCQNQDWESLPSLDGREHWTTRDYSEFAKKNGYDGVIFNNIYDVGIYSSSSEANASNVVVVYDSNQIKSIYNENPTENPDIRYSLSIDSEGNNLSEGQKEYFKDSKIVDESGALKVMYHGTKADFNVFDPMVSGGINGIAEGYGLYFADTPKVSEAYGDRILKGYLNITKPASTKSKTIKQRELESLIKATIEKEAQDFIEDGSYDNLKDAMRDTWISNYVYTYDKTIDASVKEVAKNILSINDNDSDIVREVMSGLAIRNYNQAYRFYETLTEVTGIDGFEAEWTDSNTGEKSQIVLALNSEQFKNADNLNPTENPDIRYSINTDFDFMDEFIFGEQNEEQNKDYIDTFNIVEEGFSALKDTEVDTKAVVRIANRLRNEYGSQINVSEFASNLTSAFAYMQQSDHVNYNEMMSIVQNIALPVIENSNQTVGREVYDNFRNALKGYKIKLNDKQMSEVKSTFGSYAAFKDAVYPLVISNNGTELDSIWSEIVEASGYVLDMDTSDTNQPSALYDALSAMRPTIQNTYGGSQEDVARDLAMRIIEEYLNDQSKSDISNIKKEAVKKATDKLRAKHKSYISNLRQSYNDRLKKVKAETRMNERMKQAEKSKAYEEEILRIKATNKQRASEAKERVEVNRRKKAINSKAKDLYTWLQHPTENKHIPTDMVVPLTDFLSALDFVEPSVKEKDGKYIVKIFDHSYMEDGHRKMVYETIEADTVEEALAKYHEAIEGGKGSRYLKSWKERMRDLQSLYNHIKDGTQDFEEGDMNNFVSNLSEELADEFNQLLENKGILNVNQLNSNELRVVQHVLDNITHAINMGNKMATMDTTSAELAEGLYTKADSHDKIGRTADALSMLKKTFKFDMLNPKTFMTLLGESGDKIYLSLREGMNKQIRNYMNASKFMEDLRQTVDKKEISKWSGKNAREYTFDVFDGSITMTTAEIMSLYETMKRDGSTERILGGIVSAPRKATRHGVTMDVPKGEAVHVTAQDVANITSVLTDDQKRIADAMQHYMATVCTDLGNETSLRLYGYKKYSEERYFPYSVDKSNTMTSDRQVMNASLYGAERPGFSNSLVPNAKAPLIMRDIFDVFTDHVSEMATYNGLAPALKDTLRVINYKTVTEDQGKFTYHNTKDAINKITGSSSQQEGMHYITQLLLDLNHSQKSNYVGSVTEKLISNYKAAAVGGNMRVVFQQPGAFFRALYKVKPTSLAYALAHPVKSQKNRVLANESSETMWWKSQGYYETSIGRDIKQILTGEESISEKIKNASMAPAGWADDFTWGYLYTAVEREVLQENRGKTADEMRSEINKRFDDMIDSTQVIDSTLHRSQYMRSKDTLNVIQTAFMAEPTKSYNMLYESVFKDSREKGKAGEIGKALAAFILSQALTSGLAAIWDMLRKSKDDDDKFDVFLENAKSNFFDNIAPWGMIPVLKDVIPSAIDWLQGEVTMSNNNRLDTEGISQIATVLKDAYDVSKGESKKTAYGVLLDAERAFSSVTGIPLYNVTRDTVALVNLFTDNLQTKVETNIYKSTMTAIDEDKSLDKIDDLVDKLIANGGNIDDLQSKIQSKYKSDYYAAYTEDDQETMDYIRDRAIKGYVATGMTPSEASEVVRGWTEDPQYTYDKLMSSIDEWSGVEEGIDALLEKGKKPEEIAEKIVANYSSTLDYINDNNIDNDLEDRVSDALRYIDPEYTIENVKAKTEAKEQAKAEKAEATAIKSEQKERLFQATETGGDYKGAIRDMLQSGMEGGDIKSALTSEYKPKLKELYKTDKSEYTRLKNRIITVRVEIDQRTGFKGNGKKSYSQYETETVEAWLK